MLSNIFSSKAIAIEQEGVYYETDETTEYVNEMADYVEDKYQPCAKDNNYLEAQYNDFVKKIKCNNIDSNLNGLNVNTIPGSTTAEDIGTQALQGDDTSVNSFGNAQRVKGNFNLDCINNNNNIGGQGRTDDGGTATVGPRGPVGPQGPEGIQGIQGLPGPNVINATNLYYNPGEIAESFVNFDDKSTATCEGGDIAVGGNYNILGANPANPYLVTFQGNEGTDKYSTIIRVHGSSSTGIIVFQSNVLCFDNPPLNTFAATASAISSVQQQLEDSRITAQGISDSPKLTTLEKQPEGSGDLTATEKITKLKTQWLSQLP
jgi:hypothetical protein